MNGDIYKLREELLGRISCLDDAIAQLEAYANYSKVLADRLAALESTAQLSHADVNKLLKRLDALEANKCQCGAKATKEIRSALPG